MKIFVLGLGCAAPELLFDDERLTNLRRLMEAGCYGKLENVVPPMAVPAWMSMATSQDPGSLGVYGFRNRSDYSYNSLGRVDSKSIQAPAIWDQVSREGGRPIIIGVPPSYPPRKIDGICVSCLLTPDTGKDIYTHPDNEKDKIGQLVGAYPVDVKGFRTRNKAWLKDEIYAMSRKQFEVVRHFMRNSDWDYFQFVEIGVDRLHHGFWQFHDPQHVMYAPGNPFQEVIRDYYLHLDDELGKLLELLQDDTIVLVVSDHGAQRLDGGFCINEWLVKEGLLVLNEYPKEITPFNKLNVNWSKTKVWGEGGYHARIFFNIKGREPNGIIHKEDFEKIRDEVKSMLEATVDEQRKPLGTQVFKPEEVYRTVRNVAPDLIVYFGRLSWSSSSDVGYPGIHFREHDLGPDGCNHSPWGSFILAASNNPLQGEIKGAHLLNMAPTLLELGGYDLPASIQGTSLVAGKTSSSPENAVVSANEEELIRERLKGLGYIS